MKAIVFLWIALVIAGVVGWVLNIVDLFGSQIFPLTGETILRIVGIFIVPLGAILGYF